MDEGNVGKDLAIKEKIDNVVTKIKSGENLEQEELIIAVKGVGIPLTIEKDEKEDSHKINILGVHILTLEDEELSFTDGWEEELKSKTEGIIDAEDLINELKEMEISLIRQKEEQERDNGEEKGQEERDESDLSEEEKNKQKPEREEQEKEEGEEENQPVNRKFPKKDSSWIEVRGDRETDEMRTFSTMLKKEYPNHMQGAERFFIAPNPKDANDYNLYVADSQGNVINEIPLEHTEGKNPMDEDVLTYGKDGSNAKTKQPIQILKIGNSVNGAMLVITEGTRTGTEIHIANRSRGDDYQGHKISSSLSQKEFMDAEESVKKATSSNYGEREQGSREKKYYEALNNLEKQGVPDENNPVKDKNGINVVEVENFNDLVGSMAAVFAKEYGLSKDCAMYVATEVLEEGKDFDNSLKEGILQEEREKESKGTIPPGAAERLAEGRYEAAINGDTNEQREEEQEKIPGQKRGV